MRFEVPQFLSIEDKLFGPFSFRQAIYLAGGGALIYLLFKVLPTYLAFILGLPVGTFALALVFYKPNGQPFIKMVGSVVNYMTSKKFYLWQNPQKRYIEEIQKVKKEGITGKIADEVERAPRIGDIARGLDIIKRVPK